MKWSVLQAQVESVSATEQALADTGESTSEGELSRPALLIPPKKKEDDIPDARSRGRLPRLGLWPVLLRGKEAKSQNPTEVAQEARFAYFLIVITFFVDWISWFVLINGLFHSYLNRTLLSIFPSAALWSSEAISTTVCLFIGSLYPASFAIYEINFYRSDLHRDEQAAAQGQFFDKKNLGQVVFRLVVIGTALAVLVYAVRSLLSAQSSAIEVSLLFILAIVFCLGIVRFGNYIGFVFGVRALILVVAAYVTSYPLEMLIYGERINLQHIENKRTELANRISLRMETLGDSPPRTFDIAAVYKYLNSTPQPPDSSSSTPKSGSVISTTKHGIIFSKYSLCFSSLMQPFLGSLSLQRLQELAIEKKRLQESLDCATICTTRNVTETTDAESCINKLDKEYKEKKSGGLSAVCFYKIKVKTNNTASLTPGEDTLRRKRVSAWMDARRREAADIDKALGTQLLARAAEAHARCIGSISVAKSTTAPANPSLPANPETKPPAEAKQSSPKDSSAAEPLSQRSVADDMQLVNSWQRILNTIKTADNHEIYTIDQRYKPEICSGVQIDQLDRFCIEPPALSEQLLILTSLKGKGEDSNARAFALFIAMVLPLLVILNKLLASEELHRSLSRRPEWSIGSPQDHNIDKEVLMEAVLSDQSTHTQQKQALMRLAYIGLLDQQVEAIVRALDSPPLSELLNRLPINRKSTQR